VKESIVTFVEGCTDVAGEGREVRDGLGLGKCGLGPGVGSVQYVYAKVRAASADPKADVEAVEQHWKELGVTTERNQTGGEDPILGVRGGGGPVSSSDFQADPRGYTIDGSSRRVMGDFDKMSLDAQECRTRADRRSGRRRVGPCRRDLPGRAEACLQVGPRRDRLPDATRRTACPVAEASLPVQPGR
jgi:hypothetical protein